MPPETLLISNHLLAEVRRFAIKPQERTLFDVGARGHWENPISDLLSFFMNPDAEHGLGGWFLESYLLCTRSSKCAVQGAIIHREYPTKSGRIDLLIEGNDWVLIIENKINATVQNPLDCYESSAKQMGKKTIVLSILSPRVEGESNWKPITYQEFLTALESRTPASSTSQPPTKWLSFANEFILHLKNLISKSTPMTEEQFTFAEANLVALSDAKTLEATYKEQLIMKVSQILSNEDPESKWSGADAGWTLTWKGRLGVELMLQTPDRTEGNPNRKFNVGAWLNDFEEDQIEALQKRLGTHFVIKSRRKYHEWDASAESSSEAIALLKQFVAAVRATRENAQPQ